MQLGESNLLLLAFPGYREPASRLAARAGIDCADIEIHRFPDGESLVRLPETLAEHTVIYLSFDDPNRQLIELELAAATALQIGAHRLTLIAPYLCYMRQDKAFHAGEAISQRIIGELLARRFDRLISVDPHLHRVNDLSEAVPVRRAINVSAAPALAAWLAMQADRPVLIGPDAESSQWVAAIASRAGLDFAVARKTRSGDRDVRIELPDLDVAGRDVVLVDDVASTGQTLAETAKQIVARDAASVSALVTHALFVGDALTRLRDAGVGEVWSTDSLLHPSNRVHLDELLAAALIGG